MKINNVIVEILINITIPIAIGVALRISLFDITLLVLGCSLIDIDHVFYYVFSRKTTVGMILFFRQEFSIHKPHFYVFHTVEFLTASIYLAYIFQSRLFYLFLGFLINFMIDTITYLQHYRSVKPWISYFSATWYLLLQKMPR